MNRGAKISHHYKYKSSEKSASQFLEDTFLEVFYSDFNS